MRAPLPQLLWIPGPLPGLNELINTRGSAKGRANPWAAAKKKWHSTIGLLARHQQLRPFDAAHWTYLFIEKHEKRDKTNIAAAACKLIEDSIVENGYLKNDGWSQVLSYQHWFVVNESNPGVLLYLGNCCITQSQMELLYGQKVLAQR